MAVCRSNADKRFHAIGSGRSNRQRQMGQRAGGRTADRIDRDVACAFQKSACGARGISAGQQNRVISVNRHRWRRQMFNGEQGDKHWRISCGCKAAGGGIRPWLRPDNQHLHEANMLRSSSLAFASN